VWTSIESTRTNYGATRQYSSADQAPWFSYSAAGTSHTVWYENAQSVDAKLAIVDKYGLAGAAFWRLGHEDPAVWSKARARWGTLDTVAPTAPTGLTGTAGSRSASLKWTASTDTGGSGVASYEVWRASAASGPFKQLSTPKSTSYVNNYLVTGQTYWYYVKARDGAGNVSAPSASVSVRSN
jgi:GH18 family chitinase